MAGNIPSHLIDEIRGQVDLADLISEYVSLSRSGKSLKGLCPFHQEKTPSFMVNPELQVFHCFGCGIGGNVYHFLMKYENCSFPEAVRILAQRVGISLPERAGAANPEQDFRERLLALNEQVCGFFRENLQASQGKRARDYLATRRIGSEACKRFGLGYACAGWDTLLRAFTQKGYDPRFLEQAGLIKKKEQGSGYYDRFRDRLMFPLRSAEGRVLGFGGRILGGDTKEAKYINSPETPVYRKGENLYGLFEAKSFCRQTAKAVLVEGYLDLITLVQGGVEGVVAGLGTALTRAQCQLLRRFVRSVTILYDGDLAGKTAAQRGYELLLEAGLAVKVVELPVGSDPDSFVQTEGAERMGELLDLAKPFLECLISRETESVLNLPASDRWQCLERLLPYLNRVANGPERDEYARSAAEGLRFRPEVVMDYLEKTGDKGGGSRAGFRESAIPRPGAGDRAKGTLLPEKEQLAEKWLIQVALGTYELIDNLRGRVTPGDFADRDLAAILEVLFEVGQEGMRRGGIALLLEKLPDEGARCLASQLSLERFECEDPESLVAGCLRTLKERRIQEELSRIQRRMKEAQQGKRHEELRALSERKSQVLREQQNLVSQAEAVR